MTPLTKEEIVTKLKDKGLSVFSLSEYLEIHQSDSVLNEPLKDIWYIRQQGSLFILNKYTAKDFFNIAFEGNEDSYLNQIIKILNIYAYFDYIFYTANDNGFSISGQQIDATYIKKIERKEPESPKKEVFSNLCKEIMLGPVMECTLGMQNTEFTYKDLYEKVIYPQFKEMLKESIGLEISHISQFDDNAFELLKMAKI